MIKGQTKVNRNDTWLTPFWLVKACTKHINAAGFDLDPCAFPGHPTARESYILTDGQDGLEMPWFGHVWINPPYSSVAKWVDRAINDKDAKSITMLLANRTDTRWFSRLFPVLSSLTFIRGRISFLSQDTMKPTTGTPFGSMIAEIGRGIVVGDNLSFVQPKVCVVDRDELETSHLNGTYAVRTKYC